MTGQIDLSTPIGCRTELERCSRGLAEIVHEYAAKRAELSALEAQMDALEAVEFLRATGDTATERKAQATKAIVQNDNDIYARTAILRGETEALKARIRGLESRGSHAQSSMNGHLQEEKMSGFRREG